MWILIRWLHQKPADLDHHCFLKRINPGFAGHVLTIAMLSPDIIYFENSVDQDQLASEEAS